MKYEEMPYSRIDFMEETRYLKELMKRFPGRKERGRTVCRSSGILQNGQTHPDRDDSGFHEKQPGHFPMRFTIRRRIIMTGSNRLTAISLWSTRSCC